MKLQVPNITMEKPENKKRRSRERPDHEKKRRKKKNHTLLKTTENKNFYPNQFYESDKNDRGRDKSDVNYHHCDREEEDFNHSAFSSSSEIIGESGIFDFPWLKDEDCMFRTDDVDQLCRSSLEDMASEEQMSFHLYFDHLQDTDDWIDMNQGSDKQGFCVDSKSDFDEENELGRMEYYIWTSVLNQPLN